MRRYNPCILDQTWTETRLGACEALAEFKGRAAPAVPKLRQALQADDLWLRVKAAEYVREAIREIREMTDKPKLIKSH